MSRRSRNGGKNGGKPRAEDVDFAGALADKSEQGAGTNPCISSCHTSLAKALQNFVCAENDGDRIPVTAAELPPGDAAGGGSVVDNNAADVVMEDQKSERSGSDGTGPLPKPMLADRKQGLRDPKPRLGGPKPRRRCTGSTSVLEPSSGQLCIPACLGVEQQGSHVLLVCQSCDIFLSCVVSKT